MPSSVIVQRGLWHAAKQLEHGGWNSRLRLGHVDNGARHAADEDHAAGALSRHQVAGDRGGEEVGAVDIDSPELAHTIDGVVDGLEVLGEAGRGDQVVDLAVRCDDLGYALIHGLRIGDISIVCRDLGDPDLQVSQVQSSCNETMMWRGCMVVEDSLRGIWVLSLEGIRQQLGLLLGLLLVHVDEGQVGAGVDHALAHDQAQATGAAGDEADAAVE